LRAGWDFQFMAAGQRRHLDRRTQGRLAKLMGIRRIRCVPSPLEQLVLADRDEA